MPARRAPDTEVPLSCRVLAIASGKGGVGKSSVTVNLAAALAAHGQRRRCARRRHLGLLGPAAARHLRSDGGEAGRRVGQAQDHPQRAQGRRRHAQDRVDRFPGRRGDGADVARADAHQGGRAVPARRPLGRPRLPAHRHAAGHRRRPDGARPAAAPHRPRDRHHAGARRPEGRPAGGRHGAAQLPARRRRDREHEHASPATTVA